MNEFDQDNFEEMQKHGNQKWNKNHKKGKFLYQLEQEVKRNPEFYIPLFRGILKFCIFVGALIVFVFICMFQKAQRNFSKSVKELAFLKGVRKSPSQIPNERIA